MMFNRAVSHGCAITPHGFTSDLFLIFLQHGMDTIPPSTSSHHFTKICSLKTILLMPADFFNDRSNCCAFIYHGLFSYSTYGVSGDCTAEFYAVHWCIIRAYNFTRDEPYFLAKKNSIKIRSSSPTHSELPKPALSPPGSLLNTDCTQVHDPP
jgi:hypothetical protein